MEMKTTILYRNDREKRIVEQKYGLFVNGKNEMSKHCCHC